MAETDQEDRTEAATGRRLERARAEGQVAVSPELAALFLLAGTTAVLLMRAPFEVSRLATGLAGIMAAAGTLDGPAAIGAALAAAGWEALRALLALFTVAMTAGVAAVLVQAGLVFNPAAVLPDLARLSPRRGLKRVFGTANLIQAGKSLVKVAIVGTALWRLLCGRRDLLGAALQRAPATLPTALAGLIGAILITAVIAQVAIAGFDIMIVRVRHARSLRMSRVEVKQEARESDGDPQVKARLRRLRTLRAKYRMAQAVARATVVVTNPTHYAVALAYDRSRNAAPRVVAKGMDAMAARIRAIAEEHRVPLVANPPLARALHRLELESDVPPEHYQAVAELIAYVWRLQGHARARADR